MTEAQQMYEFKYVSYNVNSNVPISEWMQSHGNSASVRDLGKFFISADIGNSAWEKFTQALINMSVYHLYASFTARSKKLINK